MALFLLIRHGENDFVKKDRLAGRLPGVHLNDKGRQQAQDLAEKLVNAPVKAIYSSPLERTKETAEPIASALNLQVQILDNLIEVDFGEWQDKSLKALRRLKLWKIVQNMPSRMRFPGGESYNEAQLRIAGELERLANIHEAKDLVICVSHSDLIALAVAYYIGMPLDAFQRLSISPGSITGLLIGEGSSRLLSMNYSADYRFGKA